MDEKRRLFYYGWVVVAVSFVTMAVAVSMRTSFSVFFPSFLEEFGWKRGVTSLAFSFNMIAFTVAAPFVGILIDRYGPRVVMPVGATILALGMGLSSRISELWHFYLLQGVIVGMAVGTMSYLGHSSFLPNWFVRLRGVAIGIAFSGVGVGQVFIVPWAQKLILAMGWRQSLVVLGILTAAILVPLNAVLQRHRPQDMGLLPDGDPAEGGAKVETVAAPRLTIVDEGWVSVDWDLGKAVKTDRFWLIFSAFLLTLVSWYVILVHQIAYIIDVGYSKTLAAFVVGFSGLATVCGGVALGHLSDRIGREKVWALGCLGYVLGALTLMALKYPGREWMLYLSLWAFVGFGSGGLSALLPAIPADIFHGAHFGSIYGALMVGGGIGGALGPWLAGYINDITGSYDLAFALVIICSGLAALCVWLAAPRKVRRVRWNNG